VLDPGFKEEAAQAGRMTVVVNAHKEVCAVQKLDGVPLPSAAVCSLNKCSSAKPDNWLSWVRSC